jgi:hypothetical protein
VPTVSTFLACIGSVSLSGKIAREIKPMLTKAIVALAVVLLTSSAPSFAQYSGPGYPGGGQGASGGTPQERDACRRDTRRFCRHIKAGAGDEAFLHCLQANRAKLSHACAEVLRSHGQ